MRELLHVPRMSTLYGDSNVKTSTTYLCMQIDVENAEIRTSMVRMDSNKCEKCICIFIFFKAIALGFVVFKIKVL